MRGPFWSNKVKKKKKTTPITTTTLKYGETKTISKEELTPYSEYVAIKEAERNAEQMKEKIRDTVYSESIEDEFRFERNLNSGFSGSPAQSGFPGGFPSDDALSLGQLADGEFAGGFTAPEGVRSLSSVAKAPKQRVKSVVRGTYTAKPYYGEELPPPYMEPSARTDVEQGELLPELESSDATIPSDIEMFDNVRNDIKIHRTNERTLVYAIVVDKKSEKNRAASIRCYGGVAFGGYVRDCSCDAYLIECVDNVHLGGIPFSFRLSVPKSGNWKANIPIPEKVLESAFAPSQRKTLSDLREKYPLESFDIHYLQMLLAN